MASDTTVLITGVNRGIGLHLFRTYLARPRHTVIGAVRDPSAPASQSLLSVPTGANSQAIIVKIDSASLTDAAAAIHTLQTTHAITHLDLVIANAGIQTALPWVRDVTPADLSSHYAINVIGPVVLFQATLPLLEAAATAGGPPPKFVTVGSAGGSIGLMGHLPFPNAAYGPAKAALHYLTRKVHVEHPRLVAFPVDPGWTKSDMGNEAAKKFGREEAQVELADSVAGLVRVIDDATREKTSGRLMVWDGSELPW
ncbi:aflatoxin biosynthesis ketoreductase nor-1 [Diplodia corticola]|uniref:Aflatoxin biosynthesis ketoreductase nor-1 n=1 Tax=Diplodia corticola TaxID=236234 RepID=A0A1J9RW44_9PEZI|nr:aflatoxin biosynthesis ketoreductase nor-1 [Diplodia corticola]OJD32599.1 aflatoxin biosynthesis ketoreductase nor-1 [Diplodia corticola]